jgi:hypothetical protein
MKTPKSGNHMLSDSTWGVANMQAGTWQPKETLLADPWRAIEHPRADKCSACGAPVQGAFLMRGFCNECAEQMLYLARWEPAHGSSTRLRR